MMKTVLTTTEQIKGRLPQATPMLPSLSSVWHKSYNQFNDKEGKTRGGLS
jgi:hypothetical protein